MIHYLIEALIDLGHNVTLFASGDSNTSVTLIPIIPHALGPGIAPIEHLLSVETALSHTIGNFDVLHSHIDIIGVRFWFSIRAFIF